jgi:hypothetical protein
MGLMQTSSLSDAHRIALLERRMRAFRAARRRLMKARWRLEAALRSTEAGRKPLT